MSQRVSHFLKSLPIAVLVLLGSQGGFASEASTGLVVNRHSRNDVVAFWHRYYMASEGYEDRWDGEIDFANCILTPPPEEFTKDVQRRVNFYRAMTGLPGNALFGEVEVRRTSEDLFSPPAGTTKFQAAAAAALAFAAQDYDPNNIEAFRLQHDLDDSFDCFNAAAWNGAKNSNLAANLWGPGAIDGYLYEFGTPQDPLFNREVGHRRWILFSAVAGMASADIPPVISNQKIVRPAINVHYVLGDFQQRQLQYVAWPNDGFIPSKILPELWSLSYPGADFSEALVSMIGPDGKAVNLEVLTRSFGIPRADQPPLAVKDLPEDEGALPGEAAIGPGEGNFADSTVVWYPEGLTINFDQDVTYQVTVSGIKETPHSTYSYPVTVINPDILLDEFDLIGSETPPEDGANYYFGGFPSFGEYEFEVSQRSTEIPVEDAEGESVIIDGTDPEAQLIGENVFLDTGHGSPDYSLDHRSFRLAFYRNAIEPHYFEIDRSLTTQPGARVNFSYRRGFMTEATYLDVETSTDGGVTWQRTNFRINGITGEPDPKFLEGSVDLPVGDGVRVRFFQSYDPSIGGPIYTISDFEGFASGVFLDNISISNAETATNTISVILPAGAQQASLSPAVIGSKFTVGDNYQLRVRPKIGDFTFAWGPVKKVIIQPASPLVNFECWAAFTYPTAGGFHDDTDGDGLDDGLEYALGTSPISGDDGFASLTLTQDGDQFCFAAPVGALQPGLTYVAEYSTDLEKWISEGVTIQTTDGQLKAFAPSSVKGKISMRWVISQQ
ncbi:MAG: hypothetical protein ACON5H_11875 [Akkermansiaceae bacterium]